VQWTTREWFQEVNHEKEYKYQNNIPSLLSFTPFLSQLNSSTYAKPMFSSMYWMEWSDASTHRTYVDTPTEDFMWCFSSANRTYNATEGNYTIPTIAQRKLAMGSMMEHSKEITANSAHNVWFYFNAGGVFATDQTSATANNGATEFAKSMNEWLLETIQKKTNGYTDDKGVLHPSEPSPLGIVMFNQCNGDNTLYYGADIIEAIIEMNNKFKLQYATQAQPTGAYVSVGGTAF
jgi:hypothetical protein